MVEVCGEAGENTAIVFTSDHGYHLGEHDFWLKANLHEESQRVPLIISAPGVTPGESDALTELADIYPTVIDLLDKDIPAQCEGKSLEPILEDNRATVRDYAFAYHGNPPMQFLLRGERWAYISYGPEIEELYDMQKDPEQFTNLAKHPDYQDVITELRAKLKQKKDALKAKDKVAAN